MTVSDRRADRELGPQQVRTIVVPLDGSPFSERAMPIAGWLAGRLGAAVRVVGIAAPGSDEAAAGGYLAGVVGARHVDGSTLLVSDDPADALAGLLAEGENVLGCMASHGRDRSAALLGSVTRAVLSQVQAPLVLVGPDASLGPPGAPVVLAVEGQPDDVDLAFVAAGWAGRLGTRLVLVTVIEPAPEPMLAGARFRARGPAEPGAHLARLAAGLTGAPVPVRTDIIEDPISVRDGLTPWLRATRPALTVVGFRRDHRVRHLLAGDHTSQVVHDAPSPVLVVPLGLRH